jgi:hypothetical protein
MWNRLTPPVLVFALVVTGATVTSAALPGCAMTEPTPSDQRAAVRRVLRADEALSGVRNDRVHEVSLATAAREYAASLENLDYWGAPPGFEAAFRRHAEAWRDFAEAAEPFGDIRAEMHDAIERAEARGGPQADRLAKALDVVWATWAPIDRIAESHGIEGGV